MDILERNFQPKVIARLKQTFEGCIVIKTDPSYIQGFPDLIIFYNDRWAALECKRSGDATRRPNQEYWVDKMNSMSFASFISPENIEEVFYDLQRSFES